MRARNQGFALITVLWLALLLGLIAASLGQAARTAAQGTRALEQATVNGGTLEDAFAHTLFHLANLTAGLTTDPAVAPDGVIRPVQGALVQVVSAEGLIDLNAADAGYLQSIGLRITTPVTTLSDPAIPADLRPYFTLYSGQPRPDLALAPEAVAAFLSTNPLPPAPETTTDLPPRKLEGPVYHIRVWTQAQSREWIVFLASPSDDMDAPWYLLETSEIASATEVAG